MRVVKIKIEILDVDTNDKIEEDMSLKQFNTLAKFNLNCINELIPQLNRKLTEKMGFHEDITE